jgi:fructose-1,6-bisphosphatase II
MHELHVDNETGKRKPPAHPGLDLVRATEAAALAASRHMGRGDRLAADHAAQVAMANALNLLSMKGRIVSGEGRRLVEEDTPLSADTEVGTGKGAELDVEINAIDGATLVAEGRPGAMAAAAFAPPGTIWHPGPALYMEKLVVDRSCVDILGPDALDAPPGFVLANIARAKDKDIGDVVVFIIDRPRHEPLIEEIRRAGARVHLRKGGDVGGALLAADPQAPIDAMMGVGGAAEGLIGAVAVKALGGLMMGRVSPLREEERANCIEQGVDLDQVLTCDDMVASDEIYFAATMITDGMLMRGVSYHGRTVDTHSMVLRLETGTRRIIKTEHRLK